MRCTSAVAVVRACVRMRMNCSGFEFQTAEPTTLKSVTLRWPCEARPSKGDGPPVADSSFEARYARTSSDNGEAVARG